jgi:hypothetical protein
MRRPRLLIGLLLLATVLVDVAVLALRPDPPRRPAILEAVSYALYFSQVSMTAIWLGLGQTASLLRTIGSLLLLSGLAAFFSWLDRTDVADAIVATGMFAGAVAIPLLVARPPGLHITRVDPAGGAGSALLQPERLQFSILYLLGLMTGLAVILGTLKCLAAYDEQLLNYAVQPGLICMSAGFGLVACAAIWGALGNRWMAVRMVAFVAAVLAAYGGHLALNPDHLLEWWVMLLFALEAALLFGSLWVFRVAGYRVVFRRTRAAAPEPQPAAEEGG